MNNNQNESATSAAGVVRSFYAALARGDVPAVIGLLAPDVVWTEAERFPYYDGAFHGPQAVVDKVFVRLATEWEGFAATASEFVAEGNDVVAFGRYTGRFKATGRDLSAPFAHRWQVRDGKIASFTMYTDTAKVLEAVAA